MGFKKDPCTNKACAWNQICVKKIEPALVAETTFYSEQTSAGVKRKRKAPIPKASTSQQLQFLNMLSDRSSHAVVLNSFNAFATTSKKPWCFSLHEVTEEEVDKVERAIISQASCVQWHQERVGCITGSIAHCVLTAANPGRSLISDICQQRHRPIMKPWIQWGQHHEHDAINTYCYALGVGSLTANIASTIYICAPVDKTHINLDIKKAGVRICQAMPFMGVSCDGYVSCDCCGEGVLEVKCPYRWAQQTSSRCQQWLDDNRGHLESLTSLKWDHAYFT